MIDEDKKRKCYGNRKKKKKNVERKEKKKIGKINRKSNKQTEVREWSKETDAQIILIERS